MGVRIRQIDLNLKRRFDPLNCTLDDYRSSDPPMRRCLELAWAAARTELPILILGESGTGKTLLARAIHNSSPRARGPFVSFNAAALSDTLLDSQLFGHEKGAFTGAYRRLKGKFELAHQGTLFIDEIADMSPPAQSKILRAVECGEFERLGSEKLEVAEVRLISATHWAKDELVRSGGLRRDLFHRLSGMVITIPPLRERSRDLPFLIAAEIELACREYDKKITSLSKEAATTILSHSWPGNLRELNRVIQAAVVLSEGEVVERQAIALEDEDRGWATSPLEGGSSSVPDPPQPALEDDLSLKTAEWRHIRRVLDGTGGNKRQAALALGISRSTLDRKLQQKETRKSDGPGDVASHRRRPFTGG